MLNFLVVLDVSISDTCDQNAPDYNRVAKGGNYGTEAKHLREAG